MEIEFGNHDTRDTKIYTVDFNYEGHLGNCAEAVINEGIGYRLWYLRTNHAEFESTYRQICESFRVIQ